MSIIENKAFAVATIHVVAAGRLLILRRAEWQKIPGEEYRPQLSHTPDLPGGIVGDDFPDESIEEAALRELEEEAGIVTQPGDLQLIYMKTYYNDKYNRSKNHLFYLVKLKDTPAIKLSWEHESFQWIPLGEVRKELNRKDEILGPGKDEALDYLLEHRDIFAV